MDDDNYFVPGRECGDCTACCTHLAIVTDGMEKLPGATCLHCAAGKGCTIYDRRPNVCRAYHCLWRSLPTVDESWRPDLSGVMMVWGSPPPDFQGRYAIDLILTGTPEILMGERFASLVGGFIESGTATFLAVPRGHGFLNSHAYLNELLGDAIAARDLVGMKERMRYLYGRMVSRPPTPVTSDHIERGRAGETVTQDSGIVF